MAGVERLGADAEGLTYGAAFATGQATRPPASRIEGESAPAEAAATVEQRASVVNQMLQLMDVSVRFRIEDDSQLVRIEVVDVNTGEIIRTVPPDYFLRATQALATMTGMKGLILDEDV